MNRVFAALAGVAVMASPMAVAQVSGDGGPIKVNADKSEVLERQRKVVLIDNVDIMQGTARLRANRVTINYAGSGGTETSGLTGFGDIESMEAVGEVFYVTPDLKATGDRGVYDAARDTITLTGEVVLIRGEDVATGQQLVMNLTEGRTVLDGGGGQVQMNINPNQREGAAGN
ncbi:MAG: LptA/OstA family protein [Henriciella sp.]|uniref:LptA/OstA family protein n=1 Tax=Henriciella sp. TaxID=1968823 RepID=UPI003C70703A